MQCVKNVRVVIPRCCYTCKYDMAGGCERSGLFQRIEPQVDHPSLFRVCDGYKRHFGLSGIRLENGKS